MFVRAIQTRTIHLRHALVRHMSYGSTYSPSDYHKVADRLAKFLAQAEPGVLGNGAIGVEREALRVDRTDGKLSSSRHPEEWGSALKHPFVTTDFSESMPEYVTPIFSGADKVTECQAFLTQLLALTSQSNPNREEELLWPCPMPMRVDDPGTVPIAEFGKSNIGMMKSTYRRGLTNRYGSVMQLISGIHFNYSVDNKFWPVFQQLIKDEASAAASSSSSSSFSSSSSGDPVDPNVSAQDFQSAQYFGLIRNFQRVGWMIPYLFGTSPVIDESFVAKREGMESFPLPSFMRDTLYRPEATSLRMSDIGYVSNNQGLLTVSYNSLDEYIKTLHRVVNMPAPEYARKGVYEDGEWLQLNGNILQIENEFYSFMRPKRPSKKPNQPPSFALKEEGVQYVELRAMDVNPFELTGMTDSSLFFAELMCLWCLFLPSPPITQWDQMEISKNQRNVASYGQNKELALAVSGELIGLRQWASSILESMAPLAEALDRESGSDSYTKSLSAQMDKVQNKSLTLASRVLNVMRKEQWSHTDFGMAYAEKYKTKLDSMEVSQETQEWWQNVVKESWDAQKQLEEQEKAENVDFNTFLHAYMSQYDKYEEQ